MKILQVSYIFPPKLNIGDGITTVVHQVSNELIRHGHEVTIIASNALETTGSKRIVPQKVRFKNGLSVYYLPYVARYRAHLITLSIFPLLRKIIHDFDIVHIHDARSFQGIVASFYAHAANVPYVYQPHGSFLSEEPKSLIDRVLRRTIDVVSKKIPICSDRILSLNKTESEKFTKYMAIPQERISILPNGIDPSKYPVPVDNQFRKKYGIDDQDIILYLGRLHRSKGISLLLEAFAKINEDSSINPILILAGPDDGYLHSTKTLSQKLGITDSIRFVGFLSEREKREALSAAKIFVTPFFTGFPITFLESMAFGVPIVTTTRSDYLDWLHNNVGYYTEPNSSDYARAILELLKSPSNLDIMGTKGKDILNSRFTIEKVVNALELIYRDLAT